LEVFWVQLFIDLSAVKVDWQKKRIFFHHKVLFLEKLTAGNAFQQFFKF